MSSISHRHLSRRGDGEFGDGVRGGGGTYGRYNDTVFARPASARHLPAIRPGRKSDMWKMEQRRFRDLEIRSLHAGTGEPMLYLHGASGLPVWGPFFDALSAQYELRIPEHPGFGASDAPDWI